MTTTSPAEINVEAQPDHLESLAKGRPLLALAELIWNSLDADSTDVKVRITTDSLGTVTEITVEDNGQGLNHGEAEAAFGHLGGSWKKNIGRTRVEKRILHGKEGKGRFKAFALGNEVIWQSTYRQNGSCFTYQIAGTRSNLKKFSVAVPMPSAGKKTGMVVTIRDTADGLGALSNIERAIEKLTEMFALYLREYPLARLYYAGLKVRPETLQKDFREYHLTNVDLGDGRVVCAVLQIVEWKTDHERRICLCDEGGFTLHEIEAGIRPGAEFQFTAYIRSAVLKELQDDNRLESEELDPAVRALVDVARDQMRAHFREKKALTAAELVKEWKDEGIYPYEGESQDSIETARRQVFEILALNVHEYLGSFRKADPKSRKFTFSILKEVLEDSPSALQRILRDVLELPEEKQKELGELLERTTLSALIESNKLVLDRLTFLKGLEELLFEKNSKSELQERSQLHKILKAETWIFGEQFNLTSSDETLTTVLAKYIGKLRPGEKIEKVVRDDGKEGIIDLMLAREIPQHHKNKREFLVVELKRPLQKIDLDVKSQIESYALAVVRDERFDKNSTNWTFIAISNEMTEDAEETITQPTLPTGYFVVKDHYKIGLMTWASVLQRCRTRLELFRDKLGYTATTDDGIRLLTSRYEKYLPASLLEGRDSDISSAECTLDEQLDPDVG